MEQNLTGVIITFQIPIVFFLTMVNYYAFRNLQKVSFKIMSLAWGANMAYLLYKLLFSSNNYAYPNLVIPFFDTLSGILFLGAVFLPPKGEFSFRNNQKNFFLFFLIFILCYLLEISFSSIGDLAFIKLSAMPAFVFDSLVLYLVAKYFKGLERSIYKVYWLTNSFYAYALIQILAIFSYEKVFELFGWSITVETIGFSIGLLVKAVILFSFVKVLLLMIKDIQKLNHKLEYQSVLTIKLNQIIGRTFHEITPVIGYMENQIDGLLNKNDEFQLNRRTISYIQEIEYNTYRLKTILSAATKMYHKDMKDEPASDKFSYPIQIVEQEEVVNINTLLEIAITNFKAYISILRNPNVAYSELEKNFMTTNDVNFKTQYGRNCLVFGNSAEFVQIFYNAFKNSYESMLEQTDRSQIFVRTKNESINAANRDNLEKCVIVEIEDNGPGIPSDISERVFEPGFSTKNDDTGRGRGFGMDIIKHVTEKYHGKVIIESPILNSRVSNLNGRSGTKLVFVFPKEK